MEIEVGISNRHVHLCKEDYELLFGSIEIEKFKDLKQPNQYASNSFVTIKGDKGSIEHVRVLGPLRDYTQVEVSQTDCYKLGVVAPVRSSGDLENAALISISGPLGDIERNACIIANRHIHISKKDREKYDLVNTEKVSIKVSNEKGGILDNVYIKETDEAYFEVHLDTDDANSHLLKQNDIVEIIR